MTMRDVSSPDFLIFLAGKPDRSSLFEWFEERSLLGSVLKASAVYVSAEDMHDRSVVDLERMSARIGRSPSPAEVGCALMHRNIYQMLVTSHYKWALILEDDAACNDPQMLLSESFRTIREFNSDKPIICSLFVGEDVELAMGSPTGLDNLASFRVAPSHTVAYLINKAAAGICLKSQTPVSGLADWPVDAGQITFAYLSNGLVQHGSTGDRHVSEIRPEGTTDFRRLSRGRRVAIWSGLWLLRNWQHFDSPCDYFRVLLAPRLVRKLRKTRFRHLISQMICRPPVV